MKETNLLLGLIAILLTINAYFSYLGALEYGQLPYDKMTTEQRSECLKHEAIGSGQYYCPSGWQLKG